MASSTVVLKMELSEKFYNYSSCLGATQFLEYVKLAILQFPHLLSKLNKITHEKL